MSSAGISVLPEITPLSSSILTPDALQFVAHLQRTFSKECDKLLIRRTETAKSISEGQLPSFLPNTISVRNSNWKVAPTPHDLEKRHVEITGPTSPSKMVINALNSGANCWLADFEDALSPAWVRIIDGQNNLRAAIQGNLEFSSSDGKFYKLDPNSKTVIIVRPRGWHLTEKHVWIDGRPVSASLFDFGLYFYHNAHNLIAKGSGPYFYLPKMESYLEARLWNAVFNEAQDMLRIPRGTIRATILIEVILAAFEMEEILYELRDHASGLNAGRWDYIFSAIKKFYNLSNVTFPDRGSITMKTPFMRAYSQLLVKVCHRRGAHAMGGMAAFIPTSDPVVNANAIDSVRDDKLNEIDTGYDGTWVAHPGLIKLVQELFSIKLSNRPHQKDKMLHQIDITSDKLIDFNIPNSKITEKGLRTNIQAATLYISAWLKGNGSVAINNLMEDAATAEISRAQIWMWIRQGVKLDDGRVITKELYKKLRDEEKFLDIDAVNLLDNLVLRDDFVDFLTIPAYDSIRICSNSKL